MVVISDVIWCLVLWLRVLWSGALKGVKAYSIIIGGCLQYEMTSLVPGLGCPGSLYTHTHTHTARADSPFCSCETCRVLWSDTGSAAPPCTTSQVKYLLTVPSLPAAHIALYLVLRPAGSSVRKLKAINSMVWVRERTIPTEWPPLVGEWLPTFADRGCHVVSVTDLYGRILGFLDRSRYFSIK
jgi:hypothetical protein